MTGGRKAGKKSKVALDHVLSGIRARNASYSPPAPTLESVRHARSITMAEHIRQLFQAHGKEWCK